MPDAGLDAAEARGGKVLRRRLTKRDKLTLKAEFAQVKSAGRKAAGPLLAVAAVAGEDGLLRAGVVCGKKYCLLAVTRNRARRLVWESFRLLKPGIAPAHLVFIPRRRMQDARCQEVMAEMTRHLMTLGLWRDGVSATGAPGA